ncbi:cat eye syndrome critical region protein 2-like [Aphelenchoides avenae]|nr:cat eye syndrome critical region protein 2-like [Aphelenchus avenae]
MVQRKRKFEETVDEEPQASAFVDKSHAAYQRSPDFPYVVSTLQRFPDTFGIEISYAQLEEALDYEEENAKLPRHHWQRSEFLEGIYLQLLKCLRRKIGEGETYSTAIWYILYAAPYYDGEPTHPLGMDKDAADTCALSSEQKLQVIRLLIDAKLNHADVQQFIEEVSEEMEMRITPLAVDDDGNVYWYFGDTYLFLEPHKAEPTKEDEAPGKRGRPRRSAAKASAAEEEDGPDPLGSTNPANGLIIICKTADDWKRLLELLEASKKKGDNEIAECLEAYAEAVDALEKKRLQKLRFEYAQPGSRTSSRIKLKEEERKRQEEERLENEKMLDEMLRKSKRGQSPPALEDRAGSKDPDESKMSREERMRLREQRKAEMQAGFGRVGASYGTDNSATASDADTSGQHSTSDSREASFEPLGKRPRLESPAFTRQTGQPADRFPGGFHFPVTGPSGGTVMRTPVISGLEKPRVSKELVRCIRDLPGEALPVRSALSTTTSQPDRIRITYKPMPASGISTSVPTVILSDRPSTSAAANASLTPGTRLVSIRPKPMSPAICRVVYCNPQQQQQQLGGGAASANGSPLVPTYVVQQRPNDITPNGRCTIVPMQHSPQFAVSRQQPPLRIAPKPARYGEEPIRNGRLVPMRAYQANNSARASPSLTYANGARMVPPKQSTSMPCVLKPISRQSAPRSNNGSQEQRKLVPNGDDHHQSLAMWCHSEQTGGNAVENGVPNGTNDSVARLIESFAQTFHEPLPAGQDDPLSGGLLEDFMYGLGKLGSMLPFQQYQQIPREIVDTLLHDRMRKTAYKNFYHLARDLAHFAGVLEREDSASEARALVCKAAMLWPMVFPQKEAQLARDLYLSQFCSSD